MQQREIIESTLIPAAGGVLPEPGWARRELFTFERKNIKSSWIKIKEWDNYIFINDNAAISFTISDLGYAGALCVAFIDIQNKMVMDKAELVLFPRGKKFALGKDPVMSCGEWHNSKMDIIFKKKDDHTGRIICNYRHFKDEKNLSVDFDIMDPDYESINYINVSTEKKDGFFLNTKKNHLRAEGTVTIGDHIVRFDKESTYGTFNWCRGVWDYNNKTYWGTGSTEIDGKPFGFNIGYRLYETEGVSENAVFYDGRIHKLDKVGFVIPGGLINPDYMSNWKITSNDGRFTGDFSPIVEKSSLLDLKFLISDCHQVFGRMSGTAVLDNGERIEFTDMMCALEVMRNKC
jgi:hypothetical protein